MEIGGVGNFEKIWIFGKNGNLDKKLENLETIGKFGKNLEIWENLEI